MVEKKESVSDDYQVHSTSIIDRVEKKAGYSEALTKKLSEYINPRHLMTIGFISGLLAGICFYLTTFSKYWFIGSIILVGIYFFCDRNDGRLARYKGTVSKRGYYADHMFDTIIVFALLLGLGASPGMNIVIALLIVAAYHTLEIEVFLTTYVRRLFKSSFSIFSPAEGLSIVMLMSFISMILPYPLYLFELPIFGGFNVTLLDLVGSIIVVLLAIFAFGAIRTNLDYLGKKEKLYKTKSFKDYF